MINISKDVRSSIFHLYHESRDSSAKFSQRQQPKAKKLAEGLSFWNMNIFVYEDIEGVLFTRLNTDNVFVLPYPFNTDGYDAQLIEGSLIRSPS